MIREWRATDPQLDDCGKCGAFEPGVIRYGNGREVLCAACLADPFERALFEERR